VEFLEPGAVIDILSVADPDFFTLPRAGLDGVDDLPTVENRLCLGCSLGGDEASGGVEGTLTVGFCLFGFVGARVALARLSPSCSML
jgi:hypothetical protein